LKRKSVEEMGVLNSRKVGKENLYLNQEHLRSSQNNVSTPWTCCQNVSIKACFLYTLLRYGLGFDMKTEDKGPKRRSPGEGKGMRGGIQVRDRIPEHEDRVLRVIRNT
jgi:hypothetical protein